MKQRTSILVGFAAACLMVGAGCSAQKADTSFDTRVDHPVYANEHPKVLFDEAHSNSHRANGTYSPFVHLLRNDGYDVIVNRAPFTRQGLAGQTVLVIANAKGPNGVKFAPAFTESEIASVKEWVADGGSLLLIMDKEPFSTAAQELTSQFGVRASDGGGVDDAANADPASNDPSQLVFSANNQLLGDHAITRGRNETERVGLVMSFTGSALTGPAEATTILRLSPAATERPVIASSREILRAWYGDVSYRRSFDDPRPVDGNAQLLALHFGRGRVVVSGEAGMLTAQVERGQRFGMNSPGTGNRQLALNIMHWLSGLLP